MATTEPARAPGPQDWTGRTVHSSDGSKLGKLEHVYLDKGSNEPTWGVVKTGPFGRRRAFVPIRGATEQGKAVQVPAHRSHVGAAPAVPADRSLSPETESRLSDHYSRAGAVTETRERQHEEYGGFNIGAAFFGWLVAIALTALLVALLGAIATAVGFSIDLGFGAARESAGTIGIVGAALLLVVLLIAYFAGGYVAGRMSRFDGGRQGLGVWLLGLAVTIVLVVLGLIFGSEYNLLQQIGIPTIPVPGSALTVGGIITLAVIVLVTVIGALLGGKAGERYHRKIDRAGA